MAVCIPYILNRENGLGAECVLNAQAPLVAGGQFIIGAIQPSNSGWIDREARGRSRGQGNLWIVHLDRPWRIYVEAERNVRTCVVHVVALDAFVHEAEAAAQNRFSAASKVIGKADARTEGCPMVVHKPLRYSVLSRAPDAIEVQRNRNASNCDLWIRPEAGAVWIDGPKGWISRIRNKHGSIRLVV